MFLVYLPFISYLTTRTWGVGGSILLVMVLVFISSSLFSPFCFLFGSLVSSFGFSPLHLLFNNKDLGHRRFHFTGHGACFYFFSPLFTFLFLLGSLVSSFGFAPLHLLFNKQGLATQEASFYWSKYSIFLFCSFLSCFGFTALHLLFNKHALGTKEVPFY
jgi:hypothetical protein